MAGPLALITPELLVWARASAGLSIEQAAAKSACKSERLAAWEAGNEQPTIAQLRKLGAAYKRPLAVFFLPKPPKGWDAMRDFRKLPTARDLDQSPELRLAIREAWERRSIAVELLEELEEDLPAFKITATPSDDPEIVAAKIRGVVSVSPEEQRSWSSPDVALTRWRAAVEARGVMVFSFPGVAVDEVRGFSISDAPLPIVAINSGDMPAGRAFTLMHELAHVALRSGAVMCDPHKENGDAEAFCNHVAGAVLVPRGALLDDPAVRGAASTTQWQDEALKRLAGKYSVSREVILRRLLLLGKTTKAFYASKRAQFTAEFATWANKRKTAVGGPDRVAVVLSQNGRLYARLVLEAFGHRAITASDVATYLGVRTKHIPALNTDVMMRAG